MSRRVKEASLATMENAGRPVQYLPSGKDGKQRMAQFIARRDGLTLNRAQRPPTGLCARAASPPWHCAPASPSRGHRETKKSELQRTPREGLCVYQYWRHPVFVFMSARLQSWLPFSITLFLNGRQWLAQQLEQAALHYRGHRNCFTWVEDFEQAQQLMEAQLRTNWVESFAGVRSAVHPCLTNCASGIRWNIAGPAPTASGPWT